MGQGESKGSDVEDYLQDASRHQLLRQYSSVNVDSASECSESTKTTKKEKGTSDKKGASNKNQENVVADTDQSDDFDTTDKIRGHRKGSKDLSDASFPSTSTDKILEDYADYANELINAPYRLQNQYTSTETVNSSSLSVADARKKKTKIVLPSKRASANVYLKDPVKPPKALNAPSDQLKRKDTSEERDKNEKKDVNINKNVETLNGFDLEQPDATYANVPEFEIPKIIVTDENLTKPTSSLSETDSVQVETVQTDSVQVESKRSIGRNDQSKQVSIPPCIRHFLNQEAEFHDISRRREHSELHQNETYHQPLKRQGAVLVEVVENGDLTSEASTTIGRNYPSDANNDETKLTQLCAIREELRNLAKAHKAPQNVKDKARHIPQCSCGALNDCNCGIRPHRSQQNHPRHSSGPRVLTTDFVSKIAVGNKHQSPDSRVFDEIYDDVLTRPRNIVSDDSVLGSSVKSLTDKFERIAHSSRDNSPIRYKEDKRSQERDIELRHTHRRKSEDFGQAEEESIYEEYSFDVIPQTVKASSCPRPVPRTKNKGVQVDGHWSEHWNNQYLEPLVIDTSNMVFNRKSKKQDKKRSRHKSDSSTSAVSDSSATFPKTSSSKWKKSNKNKKGDIQEDGRAVQQWGSTVTEYEENFGHVDKSSSSKKKRSKAENRTQQSKEGYDNVRQVFNRGMVLPMKRAPPGMTAQEIESESEFTDLSAHSWRALSPGRQQGVRMHNGPSYEDSYERTHLKQRMNESNYAHRAGLLNRDDTMRLSSQSSQYTSEIPVFHSPRQRGGTARADIHRTSAGHNNEHNRSGYNHVYGDYRSSGDYGSLPNYRRLHVEGNRFPAHSEGLSPRYSSSHTERPSSPESYRYSRKDTKVHSGYASTPEVQRRYRLVATNAPHLYKGRARSTERNLSTERSFSPRRSRAVSVPREVSTFHGHNQMIPHQEQQRLKGKSYSQDYLDYDAATGGQHSSKKKMVRITEKKKRKKSLDERAKGVVDDIIDEAIELLSPKHQKKSKSKVESRKSRSRQKNLTHTTNVFNEIYEVDQDRHRTENAVNTRRAQRDYKSDQENRIHDERQDVQQYEEDLRSFREMQRKPLLRPAPIDYNLRSEYRSSIRPIPGSGVTRDGSLPPPRSAYRNYDYELSVGQHAHQAEEKTGKADVHERSNIYSSDSEYSASHRAHYRRERKPSKYPHLSLVPTRVRSEENLLSEQRKSEYAKSLPKRPVQIIKPRNPKFTGSVGYESEPDNTRRFNPPTLTRGLVTKILHKLDEDVKRASKRNMKRPVLNQSTSNKEYSANTWSHNDTSPSANYTINPQWTTLSSPSSYSPKTEASLYSPNVSTNYEFSPVQQSIPLHHQGKVDLQLEEIATKADAHARFKLHHGHSQPNINITIPQDGGVNAAKVNYVNRGAESADEARYGAFSNEQMIVADLVDGQTAQRPTKTTTTVSQVGKFYGTQPDVSMNKQQTLNFFLFNQRKQEEAVNVSISDEDEQSITFDDVIGQRSMTETEMRDYYIHHKGTQTLSESESPKPIRKRKKESKPKYIIVQQPMQEAPRQIETTHYITQQREIEKVPPEKEIREVSIQTEKKRRPKPENKESVVEVQSFISKPVITQSRHVERQNYEVPREPSPEPTPPPSPEPREIPIIYQHDFHAMEIPEHEPSEDEEMVILETTEIEEKEQRIQMSIFEEYEFSHKRTEDGKTVSIGGPEGQESGIPVFWQPAKYEVVVDKKKKKSTQVKETTQGDDHKKASGFGGGNLAFEQNSQFIVDRDMSQHPVAMVTTSESATVEDTFTKEAQEKLAALEKVLESELTRKSEGGGAKNIQKENYEKPDEHGRLQETSYTSYEKVVPLSETEESNQMFKTEKSLFIGPNSQQEKSSSNAKSAPKWTRVESSHKVRDSSPAVKTEQVNTSVNASRPAYRDSYLSLFSAKPYVANRVHGRTDVTSNTWKDRSSGSKFDYSQSYDSRNSSSANRFVGNDDLDLETGTSSLRSKFRSDIRSPPPVGNLVGESHSEQSGPVAKTHYEKDADGNLVKVTEWEHKLTKTVEYPQQEKKDAKHRAMSSALNELAEDGYINMNLHESHVIPQSESESSEESVMEPVRARTSTSFTEVSGETEIGRKPFHYESVENTLKVGEDGEGLGERRYMYNMKKSQLKPMKSKNSSMNGVLPGYVYGETMSTPL